MITAGIDPGSRNTGFSVRDIKAGKILVSSTYVRPKETEIITWAVYLSNEIKDFLVSHYPEAHVGIEGVRSPRFYQNGKKSPLNPEAIIQTGMMVGAFAALFPEAVIVPPGHNGTGNFEYPEEIVGRRPKDLPGVAGPRNHERSAFDVAGEVPFLLQDGYKLDSKNEV